MPLLSGEEASILTPLAELLTEEARRSLEVMEVAQGLGGSLDGVLEAADGLGRLDRVKEASEGVRRLFNISKAFAKSD